MYETWCLNCEKAEEEKIWEEEEEESKAREKIREIKKFMYVGETARSSYERGLEHQRDFDEMKLDSHILKHYVDKHENENMKDLKFGMRVVKEARSAFERQISESVHIQNQKRKHYILNSKSEYNRCALPRLLAKVGDENYKGMEKERREEKEAEKNLEKKIRELKVKQSMERRQEPTTTEQPAGKKRKLNKVEYKRVLQEKKEAKKRERATEEEQKKEQNEVHEIFKTKKRKQETDTTPRTDMQEEAEETRWERAWTQEEWDQKLKTWEENIREEERIRSERIAKQKKLERSWDLLRLCKEVMREEGYNWKVAAERREEERQKLREKEERLQRADEQKRKTLEKVENDKKQKKTVTCRRFTIFRLPARS